MQQIKPLLVVFLFMATKCPNSSSQNLHVYTYITEPNSQLDPDPEFLGTINNVTYPAGREAILACSVRNLGKNKVGWLRASDQTVLALQGRVVTHNARISVIHEDSHTWKLKISKLRESDRGCYMCQINTSPMKKQIGCIDVQVPPDIINEESSADLAVQEGEDATLTCKATGNPMPRVIWRREDGEMILIRKTGSRELMKVESYSGSSLKLVRLERRQMGAYLCIASNDVPPAVSKRVSLSVQFAPMVRAPSQLLGTPLGSDVQLECHVEASPSPVSYWLKGARTSSGFASISSSNLESGQPGPEMLLDGPKYGITEKRDGYRGVMLLIVRSFSPSDVGTYHCVSTNSLGRAEGTLRLYEIKLHPGAASINDDNLNFISGIEEAARGCVYSHSLTIFLKIHLAFYIVKLLLSTLTTADSIGQRA
ncbi:lachesin-like isoform X1 [Rhagoletis pomonella]|uniref:lachesin-like isoform X1 n=1 Tax=Rhagoletis pomonella TaxID=28610 RepID=UPI00177A977D|nr:lachesin-like isoform X1 [Rhagoletis pomonella]XP_036345619.1 lachesin-like isoform X1 [Rhagoletis pomonella]